MTTPTLMNCAHQGEGWCLACVGELARSMAAESDGLRAELRRWRVAVMVAYGSGAAVRAALEPLLKEGKP